MKTWKNFLISSALVFSTAAAPFSVFAESADPSTDYIHIPATDEISTMDPQMTTEYYCVPLNIFDRLVECETVDGEATIVPGLASDWTVSDDGLVYTFNLEKGVMFSNGEEFTADDVVYTIDRMMNPDSQAVNTDFFNMIKGAAARYDGEADSVEGVKAIDDYTVEITLEYPFAPFLANLATPPASILNREACEAAGDQFGIDPALTAGTGPFIAESWEVNDRIVLVRNDDYFKGPAGAAGIEMIQVPDEETQKLMFENGELDIVDLSAFTSQLSFFLDNDTYKDNLVYGTEAGEWFYAFNCSKAPMDDVVVRKAIQMSIDRQLILDQLYSGTGHLVNSFLPDGFAGSYESDDAITYDPEAAKKMLEDAGYTLPVELEITQTTDNADALMINQIVQSMLEQAGFKVTITQMDESAYYATRKEGNLGMTRSVWWADYNDADNFIYTFFSAKNSAVRSICYDNQGIQDLIDEARTMTDEEERNAAYKKIDTAIVMEDAAILPLFQMDHIVAVQDWVKGYEVAWNGWTDCTYYSVTLER